MKYLAGLFLSVFLLSGCCSSGTGKCSMRGGYTDYQATAKDGTVKIHRVYNNGSEEWILPAAK